jgi:hypothetical protein
MNSKEFIKDIVLNGTPAEKYELYSFDSNDSYRTISKKFKIFARGQYPRYFKVKSPAFHDDMIINMIASYFGVFHDDPGKKNFANIAGRGTAKTTLAKLFVVFVLLNDRDSFRRYMKVLTKDGRNSKQFVTDIYNLVLESRDVYGDMFQKDGEKKREETMSSFTMKGDRKLAAGTVGQTQRGHVQDAYRPDWVLFDDVEDRDSIRSSIVTRAIIDRISEAIDGLSTDGSYMVLGNYISDQGTIEWFMNKPNVMTLISPIADEELNPTWPERDTKDRIQNLKDNADDFFGEYMCDPSRSTNKFFDLDRIKADMENVKPPDRTSAGVKYWGKYQPHHRYGMGSDHSEGIGQDANTLAVFDFTKGELVVTYANNSIAPDLATHEFARVGGEYGNCIYAPEVNNTCGGTALATLKQLGYPNIYQRNKEGEVKDKKTQKLGWNSNGSTKYNMYFEFRRDYNDGKMTIHDEEVLKEMRAYTNNDLQESTAGLITKHFDLLTAVVIAWQMHKYATQAPSTKSYSKAYESYINN